MIKGDTRSLDYTAYRFGVYCGLRAGLLSKLQLEHKPDYALQGVTPSSPDVRASLMRLSISRLFGLLERPVDFSTPKP